MSGAEPVLKIENLKVSFRDPRHEDKRIEAVKGVSFQLEEGSFTSLVGESGSGKSVTSLSVTRIAKADETSGKIFWKGMDLLAASESELLRVRGKDIAYVFQDPALSLNPVLRIGRQLAETYCAHSKAGAADAKKRALELLAAVQMQDPERVYQSYPHELSGGMRQRAMIAMALITNPRLLIADEPTTALDSSVEKEILDLMIKIKNERNLTILFITHDMAHAAAYSDRVYVMKGGIIEDALEKKSGRFVPASDYAKKLFSAAFWNVPPKTILEI